MCFFWYWRIPSNTCYKNRLLNSDWNGKDKWSISFPCYFCSSFLFSLSHFPPFFFFFFPSNHSLLHGRCYVSQASNPLSEDGVYHYFLIHKGKSQNTSWSVWESEKLWKLLGPFLAYVFLCGSTLALRFRFPRFANILHGEERVGEKGGHNLISFLSKSSELCVEEKLWQKSSSPGTTKTKGVSLWPFFERNQLTRWTCIDKRTITRWAKGIHGWWRIGQTNLHFVSILFSFQGAINLPPSVSQPVSRSITKHDKRPRLAATAAVLHLRCGTGCCSALVCTPFYLSHW